MNGVLIDNEPSLIGTLSSDESLVGSLSVEVDMLTAQIKVPAIVQYEEYEGPYEFTPSEETQAIDAVHKNFSHEIVINPIPSNYGLITWDGTTLTVS